MSSGHVWHFRHHLRATLPYAKRDYQNGLKTGDFENAGYNGEFYCCNSYFAGVELQQLDQVMDSYADSMKQIGAETGARLLAPYRQAVKNLLSPFGNPCLLLGRCFNQEEMLSVYEQTHNASGQAAFYVNRMMLFYLFEEYEQAFECAELVEENKGGMLAMFAHSASIFYDSLIRLQVYPQRSTDEQTQILERVSDNQQMMKGLADSAPMNFLHKYDLVEAERIRLFGEGMAALDHYDNSIFLAKENAFIQEEALAHELAAKFWLEKGKEDLARVYMTRAYRCYASWGAVRKVKDLEKGYSYLIGVKSGDERAETTQESLDLSTLMKATHAISSEIEMNRLLDTVMHIVIENAGAQSGFLLLERDAKWVAAAKGDIDKTEVEIPEPIDIDDSDVVSPGVVRFVARTKERIVLNDAASQGEFTGDPHIRQERTKSLLCAPLLSRGKLVGILYLKNNLATHAFTSERVQLLEMLLTQAAISLENAGVYEALKENEQKFHTIFDQTSQFIGVLSLDGIVLQANQAGLQYAGEGEEELLGKPLWETTWWKKSVELQQQLRTAIQEAANGKFVRFVAPHPMPNGEVSYVDFSLKPIIDAQGRVVHLLPEGRDITVQKQVEEALRESEELFRTTVENVPVVLYRLDSEGVFELSVGAGLAKLGLKPNEVVGQSVFEHYKDFPEIVEKHRLALAGKAMRYTAEIDGTIFNTLTCPVIGMGGEVQAVIGVGEEITDRIRAEQERLAHLRFVESLDKVNRAIQGTNVLENMMSDVLEAVLTIFECDRAFLMYPCDPEAATWRVPMERNRPDYPGVYELGLEMPMDPDVAQAMRLQLSSEGPVKFGPDTPDPPPADISERFGIRSVMSMAIYPKQDQPWQIGIHQCSYARIWTNEEESLFYEIGRRLADGLSGLLAYRNLRQNEAKLAEAQRLAHIGNWEFDLVSKALAWSAEIFRIFEIDPDRFDATYQVLHDAIHPDDLEAFNSAYTDSLNTKSPYDIEHRLLFSDGRIKYVHAQCETFFDADGRPIRSIGIVQDITERKRVEEALRNLTDQLEQRVRDRTAQLEAANKELEAFAYSVSHDLRAPLRHIDGFMELLQKKAGTTLDEQGRHYMEAVSGAAQKMGVLIDDLLSFSRMGHHAISFQPVDLKTLVRDVIRELESDAAGREIEWCIGDLPLVSGDAAMLRMVLRNLISNALKFTQPRQQAQIEIGWIPNQGSETVIFVRDNGAGFDMTYADKLFGVFQRLHRADEFEGTGIGLANVNRIIARHGGRTWAEGEVDQGATFYFSLPRSIQGA